MRRNPLFTSINQKWKTPKQIYQILEAEFGFDFDPCPEDPKFDGLSVEWGNSNFVNPPHNQIKKWILKGFEEAQKNKVVVFLIPSRTETTWWHDVCMKASEIRFIRGRLRFEGAVHNAPFPSCIVIFRKNTNQFTEVKQDETV